MNTFTEARLTVSLPASWTVVKWDDTELHQKLSSMNFAGVDAVATGPMGPVLIEVKDYRTTGGPAPSDLPERVDKKVRSTLLGLSWGEPPKTTRTGLSALEASFRANETVMVVVWVELVGPPNPAGLMALSTQVARALRWMHGRSTVHVVDHRTAAGLLTGLSCTLAAH